jgi:hypothetical protein
MTLPQDVLSEIDVFVRGGFEDREEIIEILLEERYEPGELDADAVEAAVDEAIVAHEMQKKHWPAVTDCDRLDAVFSALSSKGIVALQNAGYTQSDGHSDVVEVCHSHPHKDTLIGYCFYHGQDLERAVVGEGLYLAFGPMDARREASEGPRIGALIAEELRRGGLEVVWDGTFDQRIFVPAIDWKRR